VDPEDDRLDETLLRWRSAPPGRLDRSAARHPLRFGTIYGVAWAVILGAPLVFLAARTEVAWWVIPVTAVGAILAGTAMGWTQVRNARRTAIALQRYEGGDEG
jgi:hypothetical protein